MIIKSNFKDYYDGLQATDDDRITLFLRKNETIETPFTEKEIKTHGLNNYVWWECSSYSYEHPYDYSMEYIGFAGILHPVYHNRIKNQIVYDINFLKKLRRGRGSRFENLNDKPIAVDFLFSRFGPIFRLFDNGRYHGLKRGILAVEKNPKLEPWGFAKILSPPLAYNELQKYIYNQANPGRPVPEMPNDIKIHQAGFDLKTSFRKGKRDDTKGIQGRA